MNRRIAPRPPLADVADNEMLLLTRQLDLVDRCEVAFGREMFEQVVLPLVALRIPGLAAFADQRSA